MIPITNIGLAAIIIQEATIRDSVKNARASRIFRLFKVDKYLYVTKKLAALIIEEFKTKSTPINPISTLPTAVKRVLDEKGVIIKIFLKPKSKLHSEEILDVWKNLK